MPRTRHLIIAVLAFLAVLIGLLIAVRVFAPSENEFEPLPAAAIFSQAAEGTVYAVTTMESIDAATVRASLIKRIEAEGHTYEPEPVVETEVAPVVYESVVDPYASATSTTELPPAEEEADTSTEIVEEEAVTEEY